MFTADSMGFFDLPGMQPHIESLSLMPHLNLVNLTSAPPCLTKTKDVLKAHREFVKVLEQEAYSEIIFSSLSLKKFVDSNCRNYQKIGVVLGLQNAPDDVLKNDNLKKLFDAGIRIMGIACEEANAFGGGCMTLTERLTEKGLHLLNEFAKNKIIFDISHASLITVWGIITSRKYSLKNLSMFASHSGCHDLYMHNRNLTDDLIKGIIEYDGIIGIPTLTFILSNDDDSLEPFMRHIKHAVNLVGEDAVCVGSDGVYKRIEIEKLKEHHEFMLKNMRHKNLWKARFPEHPIELNYSGRMSDIKYKLREFFSEQVVEKICGLNFLNFLLKSLPSE